MNSWMMDVVLASRRRCEWMASRRERFCSSLSRSARRLRSLSARSDTRRRFSSSPSSSICSSAISAWWCIACVRFVTSAKPGYRVHATHLSSRVGADLLLLRLSVALQSRIPSGRRLLTSYQCRRCRSRRTPRRRRGRRGRRGRRLGRCNGRAWRIKQVVGRLGNIQRRHDGRKSRVLRYEPG